MFTLIAGMLLSRAVQPSPVDAILNKLAACESGNRPYVRVLDSNNEYSYGILQFQEETWKSQIAHFGFVPYAEPAERMNFIYDKDLQFRVAKAMLMENWNARLNWKNCWRIKNLPLTSPE